MSVGPLEPFSARRPGLRAILRDMSPIQLATGFVAFLFGATGPLAIILAVGTGGGLSQAELASFVFGVFFINGLVTIVLTIAYRQPLAMFWTIPGTVLIGPALTHMSFAEVVGAFYATSLLVLALGWSGLAKRVIGWIPMPIVMAMVAGVFLRFGLDLVRALHGDPLVAGVMVVAFLLLSAAPRAARLLSPVIGALLAGAVAVALTGKLDMSAVGGFTLVRPVVQIPSFSLAAMIELVVPLAITIVVVQHGQGLAVLTSAGHVPPMTAVNVAAGIGGLLSAMVGAVGTSLTGPTNGLITSAGDPAKHYAAALVTAVLAMAFGLMAPTFTKLMLAAPKELIMTLGGLAMLRVQLAAFTAAFAGRFAFGAMVCFLVTVADRPLLSIGAAFWGIVAGLAISWLIERRDFISQEAGGAGRD